MAKKSGSGLTVLLVLALVFPLGVANFLLNIVFLFTQLPGLGMPPAAEMAVGIFLPFVMYLVGFIFSVFVLTSKSKDVVLATVALILNAILIISGVFLIYTTYLM
jgi:hypothetical protein